MLKLIFTDFPAGRNGLALLFLRLFVGVAFVLHGTGKINDISGFAAEYHVPVWMGAAAMLTQLFGGIFLIIGLLTPFAALGVAGTVAVAAVFLIQKGEPFINPVGHSWENAAFYTVAGIFLAVSGAGAYSLDAAIFGRKADGVQTNAASAQPTISYN
jgi:putative oxidoreductase